MKRFGVGQLVGGVLLGLVVWAMVAVGCLGVGSTGVGWGDMGVVEGRLEPVLLASLIGAALAAAGVAYQAVLRNPLADPYLLGVSSGATLATYLWRLGIGFGAGWGMLMGQQGFAFAGALAAVGIVLALGTRRGRIEPVTLLLVGVIVNAVNGAVFLLLNALFRDLPGSGGTVAFLVGGIQTNLTGGQKSLAGVMIGAGWVVLMGVAGMMNAAGVSDVEAAALGVRIDRLRWVALGAGSLMTAAAVAVSGPIGFVGLVCPHLARMVVGNDRRRVLPVATAGGAALLAMADALTRWMSGDGVTGRMLPVGVITGLVGGPFFLLVLYRQRRGTM